MTGNLFKTLRQKGSLCQYEINLKLRELYINIKFQQNNNM